MHVSRTYRFVYIGIPRTASKSMYQWLSQNFGSESIGGHHDYLVPHEFEDYFIFTTVRNPYDRAVSGWFFEPVIRSPDDPPKPPSLAVSLRQALAEGLAGTRKHPGQAALVRRCRAELVLHYERLPECLGELPFVDKHSIPPFPHNNAGGYRDREKGFFDLFSSEEEQLVWELERDDFGMFGYQRLDSGLPPGPSNSLRLTPDPREAGNCQEQGRRAEQRTRS